MERLPDCDDERIGLTDGELAALTGFTTRAVKALAHLREAWCVADPHNAERVEVSIRALVQAHSLVAIPGICRAVLSASLDVQQAVQLLRSVGLGAKTEGR